jgi:uncharacterized protein (DUF3084 family)
MKIDENLSDVFDMEPMEEVKTEVIPAPNTEIKEVQTTNEKVDADYDHSRSNLKDLLEKGQEALLHALEVAKQSEHPRAFEVVGNLVKQLADVNQQLMDLHGQKKKLDEPGKGEQAKVTNNNAIFVGSTAELSRLVDKMNKGE